MYYLFAGDNYYPEGGINDLKGKYSSIEEAKYAFENAKDVLDVLWNYDWCHITDQNLDRICRGIFEDGKIVWI